MPGREERRGEECQKAGDESYRHNEQSEKVADNKSCYDKYLQ